MSEFRTRTAIALPLVLVIAVVIGAAAFPQQAVMFIPFEGRALRIVNSVAFSSDDQTMYAALFHREVLAQRGRADSTAGETALYSSRRVGERWSEPQLLSFSGKYADYEPALSPDGSMLVFNSKRPYADTRLPARNDLWMVLRVDTGWSSPRRIDEITSFELEESYATIDDGMRMIYVRGPTREGTDDFDLYETRIERSGSAAAPRRLPFSGERYGEGDPQLARDGSYVIFTRWDHAAGWQRTCDLYIAFRTQHGWSDAVALTELNTANPDYAAAISPDDKWLFYRAGGSLMRRELQPIVAAARSRLPAPR